MGGRLKRNSRKTTPNLSQVLAFDRYIFAAGLKLKRDFDFFGINEALPTESARRKFARRHSWIFSRQRRVWPPGSIDIKCPDRTNNLIDPLSPKAIIAASARLLADVRGRHDDARFYEWF
jgi:hypothetical protein